MRITAGGSSYEVAVGEKNFYHIADYAEGRRVYVVTDKNVARLYLPQLAELFGYTPDHMILPAGEIVKSWKFVEEILVDLIEKRHDRNTLLIALGGGVIGDLTGFAASLFMRGADYLQVPTTLLAAVDSSTGGKTGINFRGLKNYIGAFKQPEGVVINTETFVSLPPREVVSGAGEIVKAALLDAEIFKYFSENQSDIMGLQSPFISEIVEMCVTLKGGIVACDERDAGIRKTLNAGHTVGHALEAADNFRRSHGEYVLSGIYYEANIADRIGIISKEYKAEIHKLVRSVTPEIIPLNNREKIAAAMKCDKKNTGKGITFMLPVSPGTVREVKLYEDIWTNL